MVGIYFMLQSTYRDRDEDFVYPYDLGLLRNINQVLFTPDGWPRSNGFWWEVKDGCGQFDLTVSYEPVCFIGHFYISLFVHQHQNCVSVCM